MVFIKEIDIPEYEKVLEISDDSIGLKGFIAIHNTTLGPALGGLRIYPYPSDEEALTDVLRLAKAMTYKSSLAETGLGGGKSVIIGDPDKIDKKEFLIAFSEGINALKGRYIVAEDVGTSIEDMALMKTKTPYVAALPLRTSSGDPSRYTAYGIFRGMEAVAETLWGSPSLKGKTIAVQGGGHVGSKLVSLLFWEEANLILADNDQQKGRDLAARYGAKLVEPNDIYGEECDIFAPCAMGGILNAKNIHQLKCQAVAGSANNQLLENENGVLLFKKKILYAPDFVINAGGILNVSAELEPGGYDPRVAREKVRKIYDILMQIFKKSKQENKPTSQVADELAEYKLIHKIGRRSLPISF